MADSTGWLDRHNHAMGRLRLLSQRMAKLATAFAETGNMTVSDKLVAFSDIIDEVTFDAGGAVSEHIVQSYTDAQQASVNVLNGILAGIEVSEKKAQEGKQSNG